ncbi:MAG: electron transport complex subunit RsxC [Clostridia bacterium]|nr:electron transport complex subunit RsxC [Clostridia bacterium]
MSFRIKGGIIPDDHKYTASLPVESITEPEYVSIPLTQHVGVMCRPVVKLGERVLRGQLVGEIPGGLGCPVHSGVSGTVKRIEEFTTDSGGMSYKVVVENDRENILSPTVKPFGKKLSEATFEEIVSVIRNAGITGMGGTAFPTHARLVAARGKVDRIIVNCLETEPFSCSTHRLIMENAPEIVGGAKIIMVALGVREAWFAVSDRSREEIRELDTVLGESKLMSVRKVTPKYPADSEKLLVYSLTGIAVPSGKSSIDAGCAVFSADTLMAVYEAFSKGLPLCERVVTVDGDCIAEPANFLVPVGTPASHLVNCAGGLCRKPKKIVFGGPLAGNAAWDIDSPVTKNTRALLVLSDFFDRESKDAPVCLRCGRCVDACPMGLMPLKITEAYRRRNIDACGALHADACAECGCCTYVCPGGVPVTQLVSAAKASVIEKRRKAVSDNGEKI